MGDNIDAGQGLSMGNGRVFLFLQGPSSFLFSKMADRLESHGARCLRINLNLGDWIFWPRAGGLNFRGRPGTPFRAFVAQVLDDNAVTDLVLLGEERPFHKIAIEEAKARNVDVYVMEMGYLRPDWVTLERDGMSSNSRFPADPDHILRVGGALADPVWRQLYTHTFLREALFDLLYNLPATFFWFFYPFYRTHALFSPLVEYAGWLFCRLPHRKRLNRRARRITHDLVMRRTRFFLYPLQLETDFQLRAHSPYVSQTEAIFEVLSSFARSAPDTTSLVVKIHPLDNGLVNWGKIVRRLGQRLGLKPERVFVVYGGNFTKLVRMGAGMVTINSSSAFDAIRKGKPVRVLGESIYNVRGLVDPQPLDSFWTTPTPPDPALRHAFLKLLAATIQVRGDLFSPDGVKAAATEAVDRILARTVNEPGAFTNPPPRRKPAKKPSLAGPL